MKPSWRNVITPFMKEILLEISAAFPSLAFIGGTALAELYLGHRRSDDLDFAAATLAAIDRVEQPLEALLKEKGRDYSLSFPIRGAVLVYVRSAAAGESIKVEISTNPHLVESEILPFDGIRVASAPLLADLKWRAMPREQVKDVFDLTALERSGVSRPWPREIVFAAPALAAAQRTLGAWSHTLPDKPGWFTGAERAWEEQVAAMTAFLEKFRDEAVAFLTQ